ncbi:class F sortase [Nocardioides euryhalodurans]|uniref:Class F sortase n=1 Tax=Nocardioides euryhalodurans TaxID=2518370 RepID=A0A4P7GK72_9ACTN|nr:class F sortase [Nocardioides euryhalodurans]QBR92179.1 class F sortase [Nocardioides euryhalodurans]
MSDRRIWWAAAAVLAVVGVGLLAAAYAGTDPAQAPPDPSTVGSAGSAPTLAPADPRPPGDAPEGDASSEGGTPAPAAVGRALPPQWPELVPTRLTLRPDAGGASAPVVPVAVVGRTLTLPDDADTVGWWRGGSRVGSPFGTAVVAGHLDSVTDPAGYLAGLAVLVPGDLVELGSEQEQVRYRVVRNDLLPSADLSSRSDLFEQRRHHRLLLITCGGPYDEEAGRYRDNRVVEAVPVPG